MKTFTHPKFLPLPSIGTVLRRINHISSYTLIVEGYSPCDPAKAGRMCLGCLANGDLINGRYCFGREGHKPFWKVEE